jgi:cytochrome c6
VISNLARIARAFPHSGIALAGVLAISAGGGRSADIHLGSTVYSNHCAVCHGSNGSPVMPGAPNFRRMESLMRPDMQLMSAIRNGKGAMPGYFGVLRDREILDVIAYLRTLS